MSKRPLAPLVALVAFLGGGTGLLAATVTGTAYLSAEGALPPLAQLFDDPGAWWEEARGRHAPAVEEAPAPAPEPTPAAPKAASPDAEPVPAAPPPAPAPPPDTGSAGPEEVVATGPAAPNRPLVPGSPALRERVRAQRLAETQAQQLGRATPPAEAEGPSAPGACAVEGVTQVDATHYILSRSFVNTYIKDSDRAQRQGVAQWANDKDGDRTGVRLRKLHCAPRTAGLRNGDVVKSVNGRPVRTTVEAWSAYREVSGSDRFTAVVKRKGSTLTLHYEVR